MECPVCHIPLRASEKAEDEPPSKKSKLDIHKVNVCVTPCGHLFHTACLTNWFTREGKYRQLRSKITSGPCPTCRKHVSERQLYPAYCYHNDNSSSSTSASTSETGLSLTIKEPPVGELFGEPIIPFPQQSVNLSLVLPRDENLADSKETEGIASSDEEESKDLKRLLDSLRNDYEVLKNKYLQECKRADFNEALVTSMQNDLEKKNLKALIENKDDDGDGDLKTLKNSDGDNTGKHKINEDDFRWYLEQSK
ncbi:unnamed protein product [Orchesella dallaii]|uniref:RING-type domain-containing protein n=1 Tax=Orchesella dallaii TaxID=48710 RepID=A0ABP1RDI1_9HEXA